MYLNDLIAGMNSGKFIYVAHPDLFMQWYGKWDEFTKEIAIRLIQAAKECGIIFELNMGPSRWGRLTEGEDFEVYYPNEQFWYLASEANIPCIVGIDNHRPWELDTSPYDWMRRFIKRHKLHPLERLELPFKKGK